jgi:Domain of Unknown Function (DUF1206)
MDSHLRQGDRHLVDVTDRRYGHSAIGSGRVPRQGAGLRRRGGLLGYAASSFDPQRSRGLDGALQEILAAPFGRFLLTAVALGFIAFGLFAILQSWYRRM